MCFAKKWKSNLTPYPTAKLLKYVHMYSGLRVDRVSQSCLNPSDRRKAVHLSDNPYSVEGIIFF